MIDVVIIKKKKSYYWYQEFEFTLYLPLKFQKFGNHLIGII